MSKYFIFLCLFLFPFLGKSQTIAAMSIDSASNDTSLVTSAEMLADSVTAFNTSRQLYVSASRTGKNYALVFSLQVGTADQFFINPGHKLTIQLADGSTIEIVSNSMTPSQPGVFANSQLIKTSYPLPVDLFNKLTSIDVSGVSLAYDKGSFDFTTTLTSAATIKKISQLLK